MVAAIMIGRDSATATMRGVIGTAGTGTSDGMTRSAINQSNVCATLITLTGRELTTAL